jgi:hypothetical protein
MNCECGSNKELGDKKHCKFEFFFSNLAQSKIFGGYGTGCCLNQDMVFKNTIQ